MNEYSEFKELSNTELLAYYNNMRDELSELDCDEDFDDYSLLENELNQVFDELEFRNL